jgi:RNA polymerase sigma-70 factor (ECF subfamily)
VVAGYYRGRKPTVALEAAAEQRAPGRSPVEEVQHREELARMRAALATLSEREQEIIRLKFGGGLGNQEIGKVMRLRAGNVAVILFRALRKLRSRMEEELVAELAESAEGS